MQVAVTKCENYTYDKVKKAIEKSLELIEFKQKPKTILLKPNVLGAFKPEQHVCTHPTVVKAVCEIFSNSTIIIGDSPGIDKYKAFEVSEIKKVADEVGAKLVLFDKTKLINLKLTNKFVPSVFVPKILFDVDLVINLPKLKTHALTQMTCAIKNIFGCVPGGKKQQLHSLIPKIPDFGKFITEIYMRIKPGLTILDGIIGMEGNGPSNGHPKKTGIIAVSTDGPSLDIVAAQIIGFEPNRIPMLKAFTKTEVKWIGHKIKTNYQPPIILPISFVGKILAIFGKNKIRINHKKCIKCHKCIKQCPVKAINPKYHVNDDCILCLCCHEFCPKGAIDLKKSLGIKLIEIGRKILRR